MSKRKIIGVVAAAAMTAAAIAPANATYYGYCHPKHFVAASHAASPWPAFFIIGGAASVILNAAIVWNSQCRELSSQEAATSFFLPGVGIAFDAQVNKCKKPKA
ncbi:MAG: hypothetical protein ABSF67_05025 [Roseiarcus sp.]|jgi:hypothetical protein